MVKDKSADTQYGCTGVSDPHASKYDEDPNSEDGPQVSSSIPTTSSNITEAQVMVGALVLSAFWGLAFVWIKIALSDLRPLELTIWRFVVASILFTPVLVIKRNELTKITRADVPALIAVGFVGMAGYHFLLNWGEQYTYSGTASLIIATAPVFVLIGATIFLDERLTRAKIGGLILALTGVSALSLQGGIVSGEGTQTFFGILAILGSALTAAIYTIGGKKFIQRMDPLVFISLGTMVSLVLMLPVLIFTGVTPPKDVSLGSWGAVIALGALSTVVSYGLFFTILKYREASRTTMYVYLVPVFAIASGVVVLGEDVGMLTVLGGILILSGVWLVNRKARSPGGQEPPE